MKAPIKILLVDDHAIVRAGFRMLLSTEDSIEVIAEAERGEEVWQLYLEYHPDVVVMDLSMPGMGGIETIRRICIKDNSAKILAFSVHDEIVYVNRAIAAGAKGYICKKSAPSILVQAIQKIAMGGIYIETEFLENSSGQSNETHYKTIIEAFSTREFDIFLLLARGFTSHKISDELCLSYKTVANYGTQIRSKLKVSSVAELAHIALVSGVMKN
ncbi:response regulator transcription factor [Crenothrix polyspora]|uniref:Two component transcriptional regulator, LuxR family n=1 Tax=Crenothrix polyspora TaxID=360316 RepID=A0A1R4H246_9GAMM|nr:response regulator transcription factor [Crenothrix polyspora]SJM90293.1 Two component transcriptional regulator, LuxR family [Crenothrix polyspora]